MATYSKLHVHMVFGTKHALPIIQREWRDNLHRYLGGCVRTAGGVPVSVGGVADHVHILAGIRPVHCISDVLRDIKSASSRWVHSEIGRMDFGWQDGFGAFSVSVNDVPMVRSYIENQEAHHRTRTFREEYIAFLNDHGIEFDERYLL